MLREKERKIGGRDPLVIFLRAGLVSHESATGAQHPLVIFLQEGHSGYAVLLQQWEQKKYTSIK